MPVRQAIIGNWQPGLVYMGCVLAILLTHEMGHFVATVHYRIPASYPYFLPLPVNPLGTMGAVIGMDGLRADRRQLFDIGIAGPLAGLLVAIPIMWLGIQSLDFTQAASGPFRMDVPLAVRWWLDASPPPGYTPGQVIAQSQLNPYFMAGWVGLFVTGLNMMPVSQLDGGHVTYTMFGKAAHWIARIFMLVTVVAMVFEWVTRLLWLMLLLIFLMGTDHPKTSDDSIELGWGRKTLGYLSLAIPFLCFAPKFILLPGS
jgi:membrane-associated protease RseP (regulator of RpoE activity)